VTQAERHLSLVLRLSACTMMLALIAVFLPYEVMNASNRWLLHENLPEARIVSYLTRSVSLLYAAQGVITCYLSYHVRRYLPLIQVQAWVAMGFGAGTLLLDIQTGMPVFWILIEGPWIMLLSMIVLKLVKRNGQEGN
jgi:hypothetical protein